MCNDGEPLDAALRSAWQDETVKRRYFVTPLALQHVRRAAEPGSSSGQAPQKRPRTDHAPGAQVATKSKTKTKPGSKGKGKGADKLVKPKN